MKLRHQLALVLLAASFGTVACAADSTSPAPAPSPQDPKTTETAPQGKVDIAVADGKVSGTFTLGDDTLTFEAVSTATDVFHVTESTRGVTLDATIDRTKNLAMQLDGWATDTGKETALTKEDVAVLAAFDKALGPALTKDQIKTNAAADAMVRLAGVWGEWPTTMKLTRTVTGEEGRSYTMICNYIGQWFSVTHDCWSYNDWDANSSVHAAIGDYGTGSTWYWYGYWSTSAYDHANWPWEYGDCYGRCGADCGSGNQYTVDCANHDSCVRNGHDIASLWCDDEFSDTLDDWASAPNCY